MPSLLLYNLLFAGVYITPVVLTYNSCYICASGKLGATSEKISITKGDSFRTASANAIKACKETHTNKDDCQVLNCKRKFFCD